MKSHREQIKVDGSPMNLYISQPDGSGPFPAVVLIQHQNGVDKFMEEMTERIAVAGYFGVTPDLYHRDGPDCKDDGPTRRNRLRGLTVIKDVSGTVDYLKGNKLVNAGRIGIVGFCLGGRVAYLMAAASPSFSAAVTYYGGSIFRPWGEGPTPFDRTGDISCQSRATSASWIRTHPWKTCTSSTPSLQSMGRHMSFTLTRALITHSWTHITSIDTMRRQTSCRGREL